MEARSGLRHLALVADGLPGAGPPAEAVRAAFERAAELAAAALAPPGGIRAVTFFAPQVRDWVLSGNREAAAACAAGVARLRGAAAGAGAGFRLLGRGDRLPPAVRQAAGPREDRDRIVGWFLDYAAREEIVRAAARLEPGADEAGFSALLDTAGIPDPDLILYAGGAFEPKDFLLWQGSYAELWHSPTPWGAFTTRELRAALADFRTRQRRFGGSSAAEP